MAEAESRRLARLKPNLERRALIYRFTRAFFQQQGFLEVETPVRMPEVAPEQYITPFASEDWLLSTSPELHMKRLLASGYHKIFQFSRCFRKGERGRLHNPEFTLLEWYRTHAGCQEMISDTEQLIITLAGKLKSGHCLHYRGHDIDLSLPWPRVTVREAFRRAAGWDPVAELPPIHGMSLRGVPTSRDDVAISVSPNFERFDIDFVTKVIPSFSTDHPTVLTDFPAALGSLARLKPGDPSVAERAEVFIGGLELTNAFSELTDRAEQTKRFRKEIRQIRLQTGEKRTVPRKFLQALARLPECGGIALGMDRLVMLFCDAASIDDVMPFTVDYI